MTIRTAIFTLCADDFGLKKSVNDGIIDLVRKGRLNAVSCMSGGDSFESGVGQLLNAASDAAHDLKIGLHLTLSEYAPLTVMPKLAPNGTFPSINQTLLSSHLGRIDKREITLEIEAQIERFKEVAGQLPDFVDGHQHVHLMPTVRSCLVECIQNNGLSGFVRLCDDQGRTSRAIKTMILSKLSQRMRKLLDQASIAHNDVFLGVNDFDTSEDFGLLMQGWLKHAATASSCPLIMCHPAFAPYSDEVAIHDPIQNRRIDEWTYLASDAFAADMLDAGLKL
ncbi:MAG: ChbG/HpnK family deacetylase [Hyphomicrobiales bacterium]